MNLAYGIDFVSPFMVGLPRGVKAKDIWLMEYLKSHPSRYMFWLLETPRLSRWLLKIGVSLVPKSVLEAHRNLERWAFRVVDATEDALTVPIVDEIPHGDSPLVYNQLKIALAPALTSHSDYSSKTHHIFLTGILSHTPTSLGPPPSLAPP